LLALSLEGASSTRLSFRRRIRPNPLAGGRSIQGVPFRSKFVGDQNVTITNLDTEEPVLSQRLLPFETKDSCGVHQEKNFLLELSVLGTLSHRPKSWCALDVTGGIAGANPAEGGV
jgi:hypothetical protein